MGVISLQEADLIKLASTIPLVWSLDRDIKEPWFDYDEDGNPCDFGIDIEPPDPTPEDITNFDPENFIYDVSPSKFAETAVRIPEAGRISDFSFVGREYLRRIYDTNFQRVLMKCGRQVEKSVVISTICRMKDGAPICAGEVRVGDELSTMSWDGCTMTSAAVTWVSRRYYKPCVRIKTRQGHESVVALTHPMRVWDDWKEAGGLSLKDRVAVVRSCGEFTGVVALPKDRIKITAYLIGDGHIDRDIGLTGLPGLVVDEFIECAERTACDYTIYPKRDTCVVTVRLKGDWQVRAWMEQDGLLGTRSGTKFVPSWVYGLSKSDTALFLNRLWSTDGHVKQNTRSKYSLEYCSISTRLIKDVQALLWKFGIPSRIRKNWPNYWKKKGIKKFAWILRIETREGVRTFLEDIACLGKSEGIPFPKEGSNNNRDTLPIEVNDLIRRIIASRGTEDRYGRSADKRRSLRTADLRETLKYPPTYEKAADYVAFFRADYRYNQRLVDDLEKHLFTDLYWDRIVEFEYLGEQECVDFAVEGTENFVGDGFITHNSTTLGNLLLCYSALITNFRSLFVSPSAEQSKVFSVDRIKDVIDASPLLGAYVTTKLNQAVFFKKFINFSQIRLRYAYLTADRVRGIPADLIEIDEIQDILVDNIPVIENSAFHSNYKIFRYSGTPKSMDNTLEHYWTEYSTQNEWIVPCERHGTPKNKTYHWNILDEDNIGKEGLVCDQCGEAISAAHPEAKWAALNPVTPNNKEAVTFEGYRIPQIMVPWVDWQEILEAQEQYSRALFYNEKLGLSYDSGVRPITRAQLKNCCQSQIRLGDIEHFKRIVSGRQVFCGIDWGCHDEETRILTQDGWKHFRDLTDDDQVAQWDQETRVMSLVKPEVRTVRGWDGPLYHFKTKGGLDMMLTGTHRMRIGNQAGERWATESAEETVQRGGNVKFVGYVDWEGEERETFQLPGLPTSPGYPGCDHRTFRTDDWVEFLGYVLSEGGVCLRPSKSNSDSDILLPYQVKMSQRETASPEMVEKIRTCMARMGIPFSEFPNPRTGDINWSINGKQFWHWFHENMGCTGDVKRVPRQFLELSKRQLQILFDAMLAGDGYVDPRENCESGAYYSTSKGLCEDFQEMCIRLGLRCIVRLHKPAEGNRKTRWRAMWSKGRDFQYNTPRQRIKTVPYSGEVYCCKVPSGYIVTERNGCVAYQGNTGENSYTVISFGGYIGLGEFTIFWTHRFTGQDLEPDRQLDLISQMVSQLNVDLVGADYGGGFHPNKTLINRFGAEKVMKFQYNPRQKKKVYWDPNLGRWMVHRTEVMSDIFAAIKKRRIFMPNWDEFFDPHGQDCLNIFSEYNERLRMIEYKKAPGKTDDSYHSILYCFLVSMIKRPRPDIIAPTKETGRIQYHG